MHYLILNILYSPCLPLIEWIHFAGEVGNFLLHCLALMALFLIKKICDPDLEQITSQYAV